MISDGSILIRGDGIAALCCAHLLRKAGLDVGLERTQRPRVPAILLSLQAMGLIANVFEREDIFEGLHDIQRRTVAWGPGAAAGDLPHVGVVVSEETLIARLAPAADEKPTTPPAMTIHSTKPLPAPALTQRFGSQRSTGARVKLSATADPAACVVESVPGGWLFLIPTAPESAWLLAVGGNPDELLASSRLVAPAIGHMDPASGEFETSSSIATPLTGNGWMACGSAAVTFDPICGDGTASAIREAILASAVIKSLRAGGDASALLEHYETMIIGAMRRHLTHSNEYYRTGGTDPWWTEQSQRIQKGHDWCTTRLALAPEPRYGLRGFELARL